MAAIEVLLLKHLANLGSEGQTVAVKAGYARNFLFPRGFATRVTSANKKQVAALILAREQREKREFAEAKQLAEQLAGITVIFAVKTGENGKMFGSVTVTDICKKVGEHGIDVDKKKIISGPIRELGRHVVKIKLHSDVEFDLQVEVVSENPIG
jgi:large subunit ribosomal protein L9